MHTLASYNHGHIGHHLNSYGHRMFITAMRIVDFIYASVPLTQVSWPLFIDEDTP